MYNSKKTELYMYSPKKWNYTCITRKKWSYTFLYIPIHFIFFAGFGAKVFESPQSVWRLFDQKNAAPWAAIVEIKNVIIWDSNFGSHTAADVVKSWPGFTTTAAAH